MMSVDGVYFLKAQACNLLTNTLELLSEIAPFFIKHFALFFCVRKFLFTSSKVFNVLLEKVFLFQGFVRFLLLLA